MQSPQSIVIGRFAFHTPIFVGETKGIIGYVICVVSSDIGSHATMRVFYAVKMPENDMFVSYKHMHHAQPFKHTNIFFAINSDT